MKNLNELEIIVDYPDVSPTLKDFHARSADNNVEVYFKDIESHLTRHIEAADIVVGCVAWLTSEPILRALEKKNGMSIIVQKEDWLRPDINDNESWKSKRRALYERLPSGLSRYDEGLQGTVLSMMSYAGDPTIEPVRCVGNYHSQRVLTAPRMHHKFIVLCKEAGSESGYKNYVPYAVWTGSFNFTKNACFSFENAVVLKDTDIVRAFFGEYAQIAALSEPLNWEAEWAAPEWRVGS